MADGELRIAVSAEDVLLEGRLQQSIYRQAVEESIAAVWGPGIAWRTVRAAPKPKPEAAAPAEGSAADRGQEIAGNPQVQAILDIFGGRVETVEEHGSLREEQP